MKKIIAVFILLIAFQIRGNAQYASINVDYATMEAMTEVYAEEFATEAMHEDNLQHILASYKTAELASAGIFSSKYLDRQALTNLNLWNRQEENHYYTHIYNIVANRIIPKTITCAELMLEDPSTAIYWGSYLYKTCDDVKSLCQQFECVATNATLSFQDLPFVQLSEELAAIFKLSNLGDIDWKEMFDGIYNDINGSFTKENLRSDLGTLIDKGATVITGGVTEHVDHLFQGTSFGGSFQEKLGSIITLSRNASEIYDQYKNLSSSQIFSSVVDGIDVTQLFSPANYNLTQWVENYNLDNLDANAVDSKKMAGACTATFKAKCHDGVSLGDGSTSYKCDDCGSKLSSHSKQCSKPEILNITNKLRDAYGINWVDDGSWSGYSFTRKGTLGTFNNVVVFNAKLTMTRKPEYVLGVKIHRAIIQIDWNLFSEWEEESVLEVLQLDPTKTDAENAAIVNVRLNEYVLQNPDCEVSVEITRTPPVETPVEGAAYHLLWSSDRLDIARGVEARLARIYTDLVMVEKFLHYRHSAKDWARDFLPKLNADQGRKLTIAERSRKQWLHNSGSRYYQDEDW